MPLAFGTCSGYYQIVQSPGYVMILVEMVHDARIIRVDDEHVPGSMRRWMGDSVGHWEGDTLVYRFTVDDPVTFTSRITGDLPFVPVDANMYEYACHEGNYALPGILSGTREEEKAAVAKE